MDEKLTKKPRKISDIQQIQKVQEGFNWGSSTSIANRKKVDDLLSDVQLYQHYFLTKETMMAVLGMVKDPITGTYSTEEHDNEVINGIELALSIDNNELKFYFRSVNKNGEFVSSHMPVGRETE